MMRFLAGIVAASVATGVLLAGPYAGTANACSCVLVPVEKEIRNSDAVFSGRVASIDKDANLADSEYPPGKVVLDVQEVWKGVSSETAIVDGQGDGMNCYTRFEEGETYLVYAARAGTGDEAPLKNGVCAATKPLKFAKTDLRTLGPPAADLPDTGGVPLFVAGIAAMVALLAGGLLARHVRAGSR